MGVACACHQRIGQATGVRSAQGGQGAATRCHGICQAGCAERHSAGRDCVNRDGQACRCAADVACCIRHFGGDGVAATAQGGGSDAPVATRGRRCAQHGAIGVIQSDRAARFGRPCEGGRGVAGDVVRVGGARVRRQIQVWRGWYGRSGCIHQHRAGAADTVEREHRVVARRIGQGATVERQGAHGDPVGIQIVGLHGVTEKQSRGAATRHIRGIHRGGAHRECHARSAACGVDGHRLTEVDGEVQVLACHIPSIRGHSDGGYGGGHIVHHRDGHGFGIRGAGSVCGLHTHGVSARRHAARIGGPQRRAADVEQAVVGVARTRHQGVSVRIARICVCGGQRADGGIGPA